MAKNAHLVLDERATIEVRLRERASFTEIGRELGKAPSTISKEVRLHSQTVRKDSFNPCCKRSTCDEYGTACSKCKLMMSHINSYNRKKLNNQSAHQLFSFINGGDILDKLGIKSIPANEINLTPLLLKK